MRTVLMLLMAAALVVLPAGSGGEEETTDHATKVALEDVTNAAENATQEAAEKICCGGGCPTPAGYCCSDGTCHGGHEELPVWQP